jgi:beta-lactamase class A
LEPVSNKVQTHEGLDAGGNLAVTTTLVTYLSALGMAVLVAACTTTRMPAVVSRTPESGTCPSPELQKKVEDIAKATGGPVGAAVMLLETGQVVAMSGEQHFPTQSVYKLPIAMTVYHRVDQGKLSLDQQVKIEPKDYVSRREFTIAETYPKGVELPIRALLSYMIKESDGTACDALLRVLGGPPEVTKYLRELGVTDIMVARYEKEMFDDPRVARENRSTPLAMLQLLQILQGGKALPAHMNDALLADMINSRPGAKRIKGSLPVGVTVAHKTGTSATIDGVTTATNDVGIITLPNGKHLALAVFVSDTKAELKTREGVIAGIARAAWDCMWDGTTSPTENR